MFSIIEHIEYLVSRHDCVTIPGWGAFIAQYSGACYDEDRSSLACPRRTISFNAKLDHNDGLLAQSLMRYEGVSYDEAMRMIAAGVKSFADQLSAGCEVSMGRLGRFLRNEDDFNEFVPARGDALIDGYFGLKDVKVLTVEALENAAHEETQRAAVPSRRNLFIRKATQVAASVVALVGLSVLLTTPIVVNRDNLDQASMAPTVTAPQQQYLEVTVNENLAAQNEVTVPGPYQGIKATGSTSGKYYMVIATLRNQKELDAFKNKYPDLVPLMKTLDYKGLMCVYVARSNDYGTLLDLRSELPEPIQNAWIYN
ncbi:MAG: hypothetical protein IKW85_00700 [Muribaculaceae bacterium]|nr:hypothetical protein [Muribaculaceae bacterium]